MTRIVLALNVGSGKEALGMLDRREALGKVVVDLTP